MEIETRRERVIDFCMTRDLSIMNTFYKHKESHKWTWYQWNGRIGEYTNKSMIDLMLTNNKKIYRDVKTIPSVSMDSDHRMVIGKVKLKPPKKNRSRKGKRYCLENLKNEECSRELKNRVQEKLPDGVNRDIETEWEEMKTTIKNISEQEGLTNPKGRHFNGLKIY